MLFPPLIIDSSSSNHGWIMTKIEMSEFLCLAHRTILIGNAEDCIGSFAQPSSTALMAECKSVHPFFSRVNCMKVKTSRRNLDLSTVYYGHVEPARRSVRW